MTADRLSTRAPAVGVAILLLAAATVTTADSDLWGHLRFGLDILATRGLSSVDPYSFTQDRPWINHEWLSELAMGVAWTTGGTAGLAILKGGVVALALALVWRTLAGTALGPRMIVFALAVTAAVPITRTLRPQIWTLLFIVVLCRVLVDRRGRRPWWLPGLFAVWANCHGGFVVGLGMLGAWTAGESVTAKRIDIRAWSVAALSVLATLATPYGVELWRFLGETVRMGRNITEWQPIWNAPVADAMPWMVTLASSMWLLGKRPPGTWPRLFVLTLLAYASARVVRIVPLFAVSAAVLLVESARRRWPAVAGRRVFDPSPAEPYAAAAITIATLGAAFWIGSASLTCVSVGKPRAAEARPIDLLRSAGSGKLVTFFDWGEYALWHLGPRLLVSMDGRRETIYSDRRLAEHAAILEGRPEGLQALSDWRADYVWLPATSVATRDWLVANGYRLEFSSTQSFLAVRPDLPPLDRAAADRLPARPCFPG